MDPITGLGAATAIQDVLTTASKIVKYCYGYVKKYRNAARTVERLEHQLRALIRIFTEALYIIQNGRKPLEDLPHLRPLINDLTIEAQEIWQGLPEGPMPTHKRLAWPFSEEATETLVNALSDKIVAVNAAMNMDQLKISQKTLEIVEVMRVWTFQQQELATVKYHAKVLKWLSAMRPDKTTNDHRANRHPTAGMRTLVNRNYTGWKAMPFSDSISWLLCWGHPGTRKSIIASVVVDDLMMSKGPDVALAVIYCKYEEPPVALQTLTSILGIISAQILRNAKSMPPNILDVYETCSGSEEPTLEQAKMMVLAAIRQARGAYLIFDGLDELDRDVRIKLLEALDSMENEKLKIAIFSRPNIFEVKNRSTDKNSVEISPIRTEILDYLSDEISNDEDVQCSIKRDKQIAERIAEKIADKADKSFTFAHLMLSVIRAGLSGDEILAIVDSVSTLDKVFDKTMDRISQRPEKQSALRVLAWLTYARLPLRLEELRRAYAFSSVKSAKLTALPATDRILDICGGLVQLQPASDTISLTHLTARNYLFDHPLLPREKTEAQLANACIQYLSQIEFGQLCDTREALLRRENENAFAVYAASHWSIHASAANERNLEDIILDFLIGGEDDECHASSAVQMMLPAVADNLSGPAMLGEYRRCLSQERIPESYICVQFKLSTTLMTLAERAPGLLYGSVSWGNRYCALHLAVWLADLSMVEILCRSTDNIKHRDRYKLTPIHLAASLVDNGKSERTKVLQLIVDSDQEKSADDLKDQDGETALHIAARKCEPQAMEILLRAGYNPNVRNKEGSTPMHVLISACPRDDYFATRCLDFLLQHGADPSTLDNHGKSPLSTMVEKSWTTYVDRLRTAKDPSSGEPYAFSPSDILASDPICQKIETNTAARLEDERERLRRQQAGRSTKHAPGQNTRPHTNQELASYFSTYRATPFSALSWTARKGERGTIESIIARRGNINARDEQGHTALDNAKQMGRQEVVKLLTENNAEESYGQKAKVRE